MAFAVVAAATSAMAMALQQDAKASLSEQDLFFCKSTAAGIERTCSGGLSMKEGVTSFINAAAAISTRECLPYNPRAAGGVCSAKCNERDPLLGQGRFSAVQLFEAWDIQEHIRAHGAVTTRIDIMSDFRDYFKKNPKGIYMPGKDTLRVGNSPCFL